MHGARREDDRYDHPVHRRCRAVLDSRQVFVITSVDFYSELGLPDRAYEFQLIGVGTGFLVNGNARSDSTGQVIGAVTVPSGAVVTPGSILCARIGSQTSATFPSYARLHGFFTKDK